MAGSCLLNCGSQSSSSWPSLLHSIDGYVINEMEQMGKEGINGIISASAWKY